MTIKFINTWRQFKPGDVWPVPDEAEGVARELLLRRQAELVEPEKKSIFRAPRDKMVKAAAATK